MNKETNFGRQDGVDLKDLFNAQFINMKTLIDANDKNYNQRFDSVIEATKNALSAADRAIIKAESATEKRFESINEFRGTLADQQHTLIPRSEVEVLIQGLSNRIKTLETYNSENVGKATEQKDVFAYIVGAIGTILAVIAYLVNIFKK
jgi:hypothetical protein